MASEALIAQSILRLPGSSGHLLVSQLLLDAGASVDAAAADGFTALMEAELLFFFFSFFWVGGGNCTKILICRAKFHKTVWVNYYLS